MLKINNIEHKIETIDVQIGQFQKNSYIDENKIIEKGLSPIFTIKTSSNIILRIETNYNIENFKLIEKEVDITKNITDISYEDINGWITLIDYDFKVLIRKNKEYYNIILNLNSSEFESMIINLQISFKL